MSKGLESRSLQAGRVPGLVSVIIPTYNHAAFIGHTVHSVLRQTYPYYEIIVVDDGSKDNTRAALAEFDGQITYIYQENQGLSAARNTGIRAARGEYIGVLDADDMYLPEFLARMVAALERDRQAAACYSGFQFVDARNDPLPQSGTRVVAPESFYQALVDGNFLVPECILVRADCYRQVGPFDERLRACEDWDMWLRIASGFRVIGTPEILIHHRTLPGSMSSDPQRMLNNRLAVLEKLFGDPTLRSTEAAPVRRRAYGRAYLASALEFLQHGDAGKTVNCLRAALLQDPGLLASFDVYYELACGSQPKGARGDFATIALSRNESFLLAMLGDLFDDPTLGPSIRSYQRKAYGSAFLALGLLSYGARRLALARGYLLRAAWHYPPYLFQKPLAITLLKALLGRKVINTLKHSFEKA